MLKKTWRLTTKQFDATWQSKKRTKGAFCMVIVADNLHDVHHPKTAVSVPKKAVKKAWARNRIRRRVYHIIKPVIADNITPLAVIIVLNKYAATADKLDFTKDVTDTLQRALV